MNTVFRFVLVGFLLAMLTGLANAQGSLQFNKVIVMELADGTLTVPAGKVWKIEYASRDSRVTYIKRTSTLTSGTTGCTGNFWGAFETTTELVQGQGSIIINGSKVITDPITTPLWLSANSTVSAFPSVTPAQGTIATNRRYTVDGVEFCGAAYTAPSATFSGLISIIEFNIIP